MPRVIAYDLTRLFLGPLSQSPRGIDRVDIALANHFFSEEKSGNIGILPTPWGVRTFDARTVRRGLDHLHKIWAERRDESHSSALLWLAQRMAGKNPPPPISARRRLSMAAKAVRMWQHLRQTGISLGQNAAESVPKGAIYLNIGQIGLAIPSFHTWLHKRPDITCAIMLHDAIPLEHPHLVDPGSVAHHARMVRTAARHADCLLFTTQHARDSVAAVMAQDKRRAIASYVRALPLPDALTCPSPELAPLAVHRYFLTVSTIEPRKNHALLLAAWQQMIAMEGTDAPHLVIVGARGWDAERILAPLETDPGLDARVHVQSGLSSPDLARLLMGAAGILCPSLAEGFGLTVLEANALGVPAIASDIPAHREVAKAGTVLLPPDDAQAWAGAIQALSTNRPDIPHDPATDFTEPSYCRDIETFLRGYARNSRSHDGEVAQQTR